MRKILDFLMLPVVMVLTAVTSKAAWFTLFLTAFIFKFGNEDNWAAAVSQFGPLAESLVRFNVNLATFGIPVLVGYWLKKRKSPRGDLGSAKFENDLGDLSRKKSIFVELKKRFAGNQRLILAQSPIAKDEFLSIKNGHLLCVAPTRSGKGVSSIIPNLLTLKTSVFCLDIKGENIAVTATRDRFSRLGVIDIFRQTNRNPVYINPLAGLSALTPDGQRKVSSIVDALVYDEQGGGADPHWNESARQLVKTLTMLVLMEIPNPNLINVRDLLFSDLDRLYGGLEKYQDSNISFLRNAANSVLSKNEKEFSSILSTAQRHLDFLQDLHVENYFSQPGNASFADMARKICSYYLVIPPDLLDFSRRIMRLMIDQAIFENMSQVKKDIVFVLDEFAQLGRMERIEQAVTLAAGYGIRVMMYVQDIAQLKQAYKEKWASFAANSTVQFFGVNDFETAKYLSDTLGIETTMMRSAGASDGTSRQEKGSSHSHGESFTDSLTKRNLMNPDEIMNMPGHETIIITAGKRPIKAVKTGYIYDKAFAKQYYGNPFYS